MDEFSILYQDGIKNFKSNNYFKSIQTFLKTLNMDLNNENKVKVNKCLIKAFLQLDLIDIQIKKVTINNPEHVFISIKEGNLNLLETMVHNKVINWDVYDFVGLSPLHCAVVSGDTSLTNIILSSGANINQLTKNGRTPLEHAVCERDPSMIKHLIENGANTKKHVQIRDKLQSNVLLTVNLDVILIILKMIPDNNEWLNIVLPNNFPIPDYPYAYDNMTTHKIIKLIIYNMNHGLFKESNASIQKIINEELGNINTQNELLCPKTKLENILYSLAPFMNYQHTIDSEWLLNYEILSYANICKNNIMRDNPDKSFSDVYGTFRKTLFSKIFKDYIETNLYPENFIKNIVLKWINVI